MARKKEKGNLLTRSDHNYFLPFVIVVTAVAALWLLFLSHSSVLNWVRANIEIRQGLPGKVRPGNLPFRGPGRGCLYP